MDKFVILYKNTDSDYLKFNDHFLRNSPYGKKTLLNYRLCIPILGIIVLFFLWILGYYSISVVIFCGVPCILWWVFARHMILFSLKRKLKKSNSMEKSLFNQTGKLVFDFENYVITDESSRVNLKVNFNKIIKYYETDTAFYFYFNFTHAFMIPYHNFKSKEEFEKFRALSRKFFN